MPLTVRGASGAYFSIYCDTTLMCLAVQPQGGATQGQALTAINDGVAAVTGAGGVVTQSGNATVLGVAGAALTLPATTHLAAAYTAVRAAARAAGIPLVGVEGATTGLTAPTY